MEEEAKHGNETSSALEALDCIHRQLVLTKIRKIN